ncbi:hypothetical protein EAI_02941, partial [Harpegnathos saltator]
KTDTLLIDIIKNYPYIFDKSMADFKNVNNKERAWMEISSILKLS